MAICSLRRLLRLVENTAILQAAMSTLQEIKTAISNLQPRERALLTAELLASEPEPDTQAVEEALERGMADVAAGRVRPISEVPGMIREWLGKS